MVVSNTSQENFDVLIIISDGVFPKVVCAIVLFIGFLSVFIGHKPKYACADRLLADCTLGGFVGYTFAVGVGDPGTTSNYTPLFISIEYRHLKRFSLHTIFVKFDIQEFSGSLITSTKADSEHFQDSRIAKEWTQSFETKYKSGPSNPLRAKFIVN